MDWMIRMLKAERSHAMWDIDGIEICFRRSKSVSDELFRQSLIKYCDLLRTESYKDCHEQLCELALVLGGIVLIRTGVGALQSEFLKMFEHYSEKYIEMWYQSGKCVTVRRVNMFPVFDLIFKNILTDRFDGSLEAPTCIPCKQNFREIYEQKFTAFWVHKISEKVKNGEPLYDMSERLGTMLTSMYVCHLPDNILIQYMESSAKCLTQQRNVIEFPNLLRMMLAPDAAPHRKGYDQHFVELADAVVRKEYKTQCSLFIAENHLQLDVYSDRWMLFKMHGPSLSRTVIDFSEIDSPSLKREIQFFIRHRYYSLTVDKDQAIYSLIVAANILFCNNPSIHFFADVDDVDVRSLYMSLERQHGHESGGKSPSEIMRIFSELNVLMKYLMSQKRDEAMHSPMPHDNPFGRYRFHNSKDYKVRTPTIPEDIAEQIDTHLDELVPIHALLYQIFSDTGMRTKEVLFLEEDCLEESRFKHLMQLKYTPYKTLSARRKAGVSDYHRILIPMPLAEKIAEQIGETELIRAELSLPYIFIGKRSGCRASMISMNRYRDAINELIKRYDMCDESGSVWHFTSKQQRKTLAVTLIEEGASVEELAYWLSHLSRSTAAGYYAEVRKMKLAALNTAFFRERFDMILSGEQLEPYSEEERKLLYTDFRLEQRRVEFGYCLAKMVDGGCTKRNSLYNCINCKSLCTGTKYLPYWQDMLTDQREQFENLLIAYDRAGILDYEVFKEYKQCSFLLQCYENIVKAIENEVPL